jgi:hypothetical protein
MAPFFVGTVSSASSVSSAISRGVRRRFDLLARLMQQVHPPLPQIEDERRQAARMQRRQQQQ